MKTQTLFPFPHAAISGVLLTAILTTVPASAALVAYWGFDNASASGVESVGGGSLTPSNGASYSTTGLIGGAATVDNTGTNAQRFAFGSTGTAATQIGVNDAPGSISFWVNPASLSGYRVLLSVAATGASSGQSVSTRNWWIATNAAGKLEFQMRNSTDNGQVTATSDTNIVAGVWNHVVVSFDGDSIFISTRTKSAETHIPTSTTTALAGGSIASSSPFIIGGRLGENAGGSFNGSFDEISFYNTALTSAEINQLFLNGKNGVAAIPEPGVTALLCGLLAVIIGFTVRRFRR